MPDSATGLGQRQPPVHADHLGAGRTHQAEQLRGADAEVDPRHPGISQRLQHAGRVRLRVSAVVLGTEAAGPRVEQLHDRSTSGDLRPQKHSGEIGQPGAHRVPQRRLTDHQGLGCGVVAAWAALDEIAGKGERGASKADQRNLRELTGDQPDSFGDVPQSSGIDRLQLLQISGRPDGTSDHRAAARDDVQVHSCRLERQHDVGVENAASTP